MLGPLQRNKQHSELFGSFRDDRLQLRDDQHLKARSPCLVHCQALITSPEQIIGIRTIKEIVLNNFIIEEDINYISFS